MLSRNPSFSDFPNLAKMDGHLNEGLAKRLERNQPFKLNHTPTERPGSRVQRLISAVHEEMAASSSAPGEVWSRQSPESASSTFQELAA